MKIYGHMVIRNEAGRHLATSLEALSGLDRVFVYDDQSTDGSRTVAQTFRNVIVGTRPDGVPSFLEDESAFRQAAWDWMSERVGPAYPQPGDWILCVDADEILTPGGHSGRMILNDLADASLQKARSESPVMAHRLSTVDAFDLKVPEVFELTATTCRVRTDGFWGGIVARRFVLFLPGGTFQSRQEGGGSVPTYSCHRPQRTDAVQLLHLGYATEADRQAKYERYRAGRGHNPKHVASILQKPTLADWLGPHPWSGS